MILDTDFVIDVMKNDEAAVKRLKELVSRGEPQVITTPTMFELYSGVIRSKKKDEEKQKILDVLSNLIIWNLDSESAKNGGEIDGRLSVEGQKIDIIDSMIAGIAFAHQEKILTRNIRHFSKIIGLKIETY